MMLHNELTGLPARHLLLERGREVLRLANRQDARIAFTLLRPVLQEIAGGHGRKNRHRVLVETARRIRRVLRSSDLVGHLSGDEFVVVLRGLEDDEAIRAAGSRLRSSVSEAFLDRMIRVPFRIGMAVYPDHGSRAEQLLTRAREASERDGATGEDGDFALYRRAPEASDHSRASVAPPSVAEFEEAFRADHLQMYYQPIFRLRDRGMEGMEALLRWPRSDGPVLEGRELLALAREGGLLEEVDRKILASSVELLGEWPGARRPEWLAVNLSVNTLTGEGFHDFVAALLRDGTVEKGQLVAEITMADVLQAPDGARSAARELRAMGIRLALDDVGAGPVPLAPLREGPVDFLKIDPVLVRELHQSEPRTALVRGMVELGHALDAAVVAEGVESEEELRGLERVSCDYAQGFHLGEPEPLVDSVSP